mmetsp:Transcript_5895/g.13061  ORF Transcript_5895/g.13061 Transcript_5895/m.13061 type:complete len:217 (-) Transcript_5895:1198-1848(-)
MMDASREVEEVVPLLSRMIVRTAVAAAVSALLLEVTPRTASFGGRPPAGGLFALLEVGAVVGLMDELEMWSFLGEGSEELPRGAEWRGRFDGGDEESSPLNFSHVTAPLLWRGPVDRRVVCCLQPSPLGVRESERLRATEAERRDEPRERTRGDRDRAGDREGRVSDRDGASMDVDSVRFALDDSLVIAAGAEPVVSLGGGSSPGRASRVLVSVVI